MLSRLSWCASLPDTMALLLRMPSCVSHLEEYLEDAHSPPIRWLAEALAHGRDARRLLDELDDTDFGTFLFMTISACSSSISHGRDARRLLDELDDTDFGTSHYYEDPCL